MININITPNNIIKHDEKVNSIYALPDSDLFVISENKNEEIDIKYKIKYTQIIKNNISIIRDTNICACSDFEIKSIYKHLVLFRANNKIILWNTASNKLSNAVTNFDIKDLIFYDIYSETELIIRIKNEIYCIDHETNIKRNLFTFSEQIEYCNITANKKWVVICVSKTNSVKKWTVPGVRFHYADVYNCHILVFDTNANSINNMTLTYNTIPVFYLNNDYILLKYQSGSKIYHSLYKLNEKKIIDIENNDCKENIIYLKNNIIMRLNRKLVTILDLDINSPIHLKLDYLGVEYNTIKKIDQYDNMLIIHYNSKLLLYDFKYNINYV